jgi:HSP20 family protein
MAANLSYANERFVYPGQYVPMPEIEVLMKGLEFNGADLSLTPEVNIVEKSDGFKIELALPGVRREDIFINVDYGVLFVVVLHKNSEALKEELKIQEFDNEYLKRDIVLPKNADLEFVCAEYKQGILHIHIRKTKRLVRNNINRIVVY